MAIDTETLREILKMNIENTAEWRRGKAVEFPDDARNLEAASILDRLAASVSDIDDRTMEALVVAHGDANISLKYGEIESEALRQVGFYTAPRTAQEFVSGLVGELTRNL